MIHGEHTIFCPAHTFKPAVLDNGKNSARSITHRMCIPPPALPPNLVCSGDSLQVGGRKLSSRMGRLKRQFEKFGLKGLVDSNRDGSRGMYSILEIAKGERQQEDGNRDEFMHAGSLVPHPDPAVVTGDQQSSHERKRVSGIVARLSPSSGRGLGKGKTALHGGGHGDFLEDRNARSVLPSSPKANPSGRVGGRRRSVWNLGLSGQQGDASPTPAAAASGDTRTQMVSAASTRRRSRGDAVLSPDMLAAHNRLAATPVPPWSDTMRENRSSPRGAHSHSRSASPASRHDGGGERNCGEGHRHRGIRRSGSPTRSGDGSVSSQPRGFRRLTRRLSFRQRQAQANIQVMLGVCRLSNTFALCRVQPRICITLSGTHTCVQFD